MKRTSGAAIEAVDLKKHFGRKRAVDGATFTVPQGSVFGLLGPNGAGKTTTLRVALGLMRRDGGEARVFGIDPWKHPRDVKLRIGYVAQAHSLYRDLTVDQNLRFFGNMYGLAGEALARRMAEEKQRFRLDEHDDVASALGTGVQRRLALACALLHEPELLILDEPTSGMDSLGRRDFWTFLGGLTAEEVTIVITTHHLEEAESCDELALMLAGRVGFQGTPEDLKRRFGGSVWAVTCQPWERGFAILREVFGASLFGVHSHVDSMAASPEEITRVLTEAQVVVAGMEELPPSMEDAFLRATRRDGCSDV